VFLPATRAEMDEIGWSELDVILVTGDTYIDQGYIRVTNDNQLGATSNTVHLNGGGLYTSGVNVTKIVWFMPIPVKV